MIAISNSSLARDHHTIPHSQQSRSASGLKEKRVAPLQWSWVIRIIYFPRNSLQFTVRYRLYFIIGINGDRPRSSEARREISHDRRRNVRYGTMADNHVGVSGIRGQGKKEQSQ